MGSASPGGIEQEIKDFFESYGAAFERRDPEEISKHFAYPAHVATEGHQVMLTPVLSSSEWTHQLKRLLEMYQRIDVRTARILAISVTPLSSLLVHARLRWGLGDSHGERLYDFDAVYTLGRFGHEWKVIAIAHNELPRYWACLEAHRSPAQH